MVLLQEHGVRNRHVLSLHGGQFLFLRTVSDKRGLWHGLGTAVGTDGSFVLDLQVVESATGAQGVRVAGSSGGL